MTDGPGLTTIGRPKRKLMSPTLGSRPLAHLTGLLAGALVVTWFLKWNYWRSIDRDEGGPTLASATGLEGLGTVRPFEAPHTEENFLLKEMGFRVARKHAKKLRSIAALLFGALPLALILLFFWVGGGVATALAVLAALSAMAGVLVERWLFFAEAKHTVRLYYGRDG